MGTITIPGSKNVDHIRDNIDIFNFELDEGDMALMAKLNVGKDVMKPTMNASKHTPDGSRPKKPNDGYRSMPQGI